VLKNIMKKTRIMIDLSFLKYVLKYKIDSMIGI
jgi:hypothetical protein